MPISDDLVERDLKSFGSINWGLTQMEYTEGTQAWLVSANKLITLFQSVNLTYAFLRAPSQHLGLLWYGFLEPSKWMCRARI